MLRIIVYSFDTRLECLREYVHILQSGDIAKHLDLVSHNVRSRLDELKRQELERLRNIVRMQIRQRNGKYTSTVCLNAASSKYAYLERA